MWLLAVPPDMCGTPPAEVPLPALHPVVAGPQLAAALLQHKSAAASLDVRNTEMEGGDTVHVKQATWKVWSTPQAELSRRWLPSRGRPQEEHRLAVGRLEWDSHRKLPYFHLVTN